jgi:hypothetical protein
MSRRVILTTGFTRERAKQMIDRAPPGYIVEIREAKRTGEQSDFMWGLLTDISRAKPLGRRHTPEDWKAIAMNACGWECQFSEGLDGRPFPVGFRSSRMTKSQMSNFIEWLLAFGAEHNVVWTHEAKDAA